MKINAIYRLIKKSFLSLMTLRGFFLRLMGVGLLLLGVAYATDASDPLAETIKPQVKAMFGSGSTMAYCIYIAEVVLGSIGYIKTKNLLLLLGVPILVLFTGAMFSYIS